MNIENFSENIDENIEAMLALFRTRDVIYIGGKREEVFFPNAENTPRPIVCIDCTSDPWGDKWRQGIDAGKAEDEDHQRELWNTDGLLGMYDSKQSRIILYAKSISRLVGEADRGTWRWLSCKLDFNLLANVVLLHELGLWASHRVKDKDGHGWENFSNVSEKDKLEWAQALAYWVIKGMHSEGEKLGDVFSGMARYQRSVYKLGRVGAIIDEMGEAAEEDDYTANFLLSELLYCRSKAGDEAE